MLTPKKQVSLRKQLSQRTPKGKYQGPTYTPAINNLFPCDGDTQRTGNVACPLPHTLLTCPRQFDGLSLLRLAKEELKRAGVHLAAVQFVACEEPLDLASPTSAAALWVYQAGVGGSGGDVEQLVVAATGTCPTYKQPLYTRNPSKDLCKRTAAN